MDLRPGFGEPSLTRQPPYCQVLDVPVASVTLADVAEHVDAWVSEGEPSYICVTGVHGTIESNRSRDVLKAHQAAGLVVPDGRPLYWSMRHVGLSGDHIRGTDLMHALTTSPLARPHWRHAFFGSSEETLEKLSRVLLEMNPSLQIVGMLAPPFSDSPPVSQQWADKLNALNADIVWVGMSTPKQELWMHAMRSRLNPGALVGVGAAFDFIAGIRRTAPGWMQTIGAEWIYRLYHEPRRLAPRYLRNNPIFLYQIARRPPRLVS